MVLPRRLLILVFCLLQTSFSLLPAQTSGSTAPVKFSLHGGLFDGPIAVVLSCTTFNANIHYTLDGSEPTTQSAVYPNSMLVLDTTCVLRARAFAPGLTPSTIKTHTYIIDQNHMFPVVSLAFEPSAFFDSLTGIYVNYAQDLTAVANIEFFENGVDSAVFNQLVEVEIQGTGSASQPQKSLEIKGKNSLGVGEIPYALFPDLPFDEYKRFVLRNGGQDWCVTQFRDEFATSLLLDRSDIGGILKDPALYLQALRPAVVYLNGQYWGIHNVRERMNRFYVRQHFGWDEDEFDMIENYNEVSSGDLVAWVQFFGYLLQNESGFEDDAIFENLKQKIDYQNFIDYCAFNIYLENEDWPGNNHLRFRHRSVGGKWRWMTYDLDFTFGLYQPNGGWNTGDPSPNALARLLDDTSSVWPNPTWSTLLFQRCWQNAGFRRDFSNRLADMLNTAFLPHRVSQRLNAFRSLYHPEITRHYMRWWYGNYDFIWLQNIENTRHFALNRPDFVRQEILQATDEAYGLASFSVDVSPPGGGRVEVSTVCPENGQYPWCGIYFKGVPVPLKAVASPGYKFVGWSQANLGVQDSANLTLTTDSTLVTANFELDSTITGISTVIAPAFTIFPNPASGRITISGDLLARGDVEIQILNAKSELVQESQFRPGKTGGVVSLELGGLPGGIYFMKITGQDGEKAVQRFVLNPK